MQRKKKSWNGRDVIAHPEYNLFVEIGMGMKVLRHGAHTHYHLRSNRTHEAFGVKVRHSRSGRKRRWKRNENKLLILIINPQSRFAGKR